MYYLGIDGSGAYSRIIGVTSDMKIIGRHTGNAANLAANPRDTVLKNLKKLVTEFNRLTNTKLEDCAALCIGAAGIGSVESCSQMESVLRDVGFNCPLLVVNDAELILATETYGNPGVAVISGTDSIAIAVDRNGTLHRAGGNGPILDDGGSGYWMGINAIKYALMSEDGRYKETILKKSVLGHFNFDTLGKVVDYVYSEEFNKAQIAELALLVKYAAAQNDAAAIEIEDAAASELFKLANALISKYELSDQVVVLSGSVLLLNERVLDRLSRLLTDKFEKLRITPIKGKPEMGAVYLAARLTK